MFENLIADLRASQEDRVLEKSMGLWRVLFRMETPAIVCYRFGHWVEHVNVPVVSFILRIVAGVFQRLVQMLIGIYISPDAEIGPGLVIHTPFGIIVGPNKIGSHCTIQSGVVLAAGTRGIGDNVYFGAGAKVMGGAKIGNNVVVAANSLVLTDVPDNMTVIGVPARIRIPGGRPKRFKWNTVKPQNGNAAMAPTNGNQQVVKQPETAGKN
ncbi:MAG TPA: DapH/DapD/GlmU-related protein [Verrucomicrobiae bacterium]|jgi:serine O-acetyltransferase|nr:DapH/DapD/GlmU-related protein [Verrucomicrobiae bacterium]